MSTEEGALDILLVDDNPLMQQLMGRFLSDLGYGVTVVGRADDAIRVAQQESPSLLIIDLRLPDRDGPDALVALRALPGCTNVPAIAISGMDESSLHHSLQYGFNEYLIKPVDLDRFESVIAQYVGKRQQRGV